MVRAWFTLEPTREEIDSLLAPDKGKKVEGVSETPLKWVIKQAYCLMSLGHEVTLKVTTMSYRSDE